MLTVAERTDPALVDDVMRENVSHRAALMKTAAELAAMAAQGKDPALGLQYLLDAAEDALVALSPTRHLRCA